MKVTVLSATEKPVDVISLAAGICYGKSDVSEKRIRHCFINDHMSVFEHASITFKVEGISRACMAQLTRHRLVSFCVESQRYNKYDLTGDDWYVTPPAFEYDPDNSWKIDKGDFSGIMQEVANMYKLALEDGMKPEDARYILPEATKTNLVMTMNVRNLFHLFEMRLDKAAQWEIRELMREVKKQAASYNEQWRQVIELHGGE